MVSSTLSPNIKIAVSINNTEQRIIQALNALNDVMYSSIRDCWMSKDYTPQQYINVLGTQAKDAFILHGQITDLLINYKAFISSPYSLSDEFLSNVKPFTLNDDGTVTVTISSLSAVNV